MKSLAETINNFSYQPVISIIMPVYNTPEVFLREAIQSVLDQVYPDWELCIADDASTAPHIRGILEEYQRKDSRIKVVFRTQNGHISATSNSALELATGEFIGLLDHDDVLTPDALYEVVSLLNQHPVADMIYSDEDKLNEKGELTGHFFKPDWCPDSFLSRMYTCHFGVYRREIINQIGGFRVGYEGSQDYDLVLRFTEKTNQIFHIPKILYHWRIHSSSAAGGTEAKPYAYEAAKRALQDAIDRRGELGIVQDVPEYLGRYWVRYKILDYKRVSIIIPTRDLGAVLNRCLESIFTKTLYPNYEVILIDNGSIEPET
ncbi:MAG: glycosyltransferase family 2 protein, partial [Planktothrix sp.]|uniref:glycosyltransferase family 2 protein n=1 Tax=Planktothrix sp. TaxID=3088171 RepID=UPI0038D46A85